MSPCTRSCPRSQSLCTVQTHTNSAALLQTAETADPVVNALSTGLKHSLQHPRHLPPRNSRRTSAASHVTPFLRWGELQVTASWPHRRAFFAHKSQRYWGPGTSQQRSFRCCIRHFGVLFVPPQLCLGTTLQYGVLPPPPPTPQALTASLFGPRPSTSPPPIRLNTKGAGALTWGRGAQGRGSGPPT